jgi:hypothetical protein
MPRLLFTVSNNFMTAISIFQFMGSGPGMGTAYLFPIPIAIYLMPKTMTAKRWYFKP